MPIAIHEDRLIAAGHGRWLAAKSLGISNVPVIQATFLNDADRRAFALAENRIAELSGWDEKLLAEELTILFEGGYELEIAGFSTADLDFALPEATVANGPETVELPDPSPRLSDRPSVRQNDIETARHGNAVHFACRMDDHHLGAVGDIESDEPARCNFCSARQIGPAGGDLLRRARDVFTLLGSDGCGEFG